MHGNCQSLPLAKLLRLVPALSGHDVLQVRWWDPEQHRPERFLPELQPERAVLLVSGVEQRRAVPEWLMAALPAGVPVLWVAALETRLAWPFFCRDPLNKPEPGFGFGRRPYGDSFLIRLRESGLRGEALFAAYREQSAGFIRAHMGAWQAAEVLRLAAQDALVDVSASDLMATAERKLFHTPNHPGGWLLRQVAARVADAAGQVLGVDVADAAAVLEERMGGLDPLGEEELPVHPVVARLLGLGWWKRGMVYRTPHGAVNFRRYLRGYAADFG